VKRQSMQLVMFLFCVVLVAFALPARSQDQSSIVSQTGTNTARAKANDEEAEASTNESTEALQKATQNPVASLTRVPVQNKLNFGVNPGYRNQDVLNIQPVIPIGISKNWNLIVRWIAPIIYQPIPNAPGASETGEYELGDMVPSFFISPKQPGKLIWGATIHERDVVP
jgi:hypothetical protein